MTFLRHLLGLAKQHPLAFVLFLVVVVLFLGGIVWKLIGAVFGLIRKVPGGQTVVGAVEKASAATGS